MISLSRSNVPHPPQIVKITKTLGLPEKIIGGIHSEPPFQNFSEGGDTSKALKGPEQLHFERCVRKVAP